MPRDRGNEWARMRACLSLLAAVPPPEAVRVDGSADRRAACPSMSITRAPKSNLYAAIAGSSPRPGPRTLEHRVEQLEPLDIEPDVLQAVRKLGRQARRAAVTARALELS